MKFTWKFTLSALLVGSQLATSTAIFANESDTKAAATTAAVAADKKSEEAEEATPESFETKFKAAMEMARTGGEEKLGMPERYEKAVELIDQAWAMERTAEETKQAIRIKFSLLMAADRDSEQPGDKANAFLKELTQGEDTEIALQAESMLMSLELSQLSKLPEEERAAKLDEMKDEILDTEATARTATLATILATTISRYQKSEEATEVISELAGHFSSVEDDSVQKAAQRLFGLSNRLKLVGNPIEITGTKLDGEDVNFPANFEGKTVLVDFWATWCGPCVAEFPNMKRLYEIYQPHGFEIVGISLDSEKPTVDEFVQTREIPWTIVWNEREEDQSGWIDPNAERYGISGIPTMIFVGEDGNVVSLAARGHNLGQLLAEAYPDVEVPAEETENEAAPEAAAAKQ